MLLIGNFSYNKMLKNASYAPDATGCRPLEPLLFIFASFLSSSSSFLCYLSLPFPIFVAVACSYCVLPSPFYQQP